MLGKYFPFDLADAQLLQIFIEIYFYEWTMEKLMTSIQADGLWTMSKNRSLQRILAQAKKKEKKYDWLSAVGFYDKALTNVLKQKDFLKTGEIHERIGYCFYLAAFQAENQRAFRRQMQRSVEAYEKAKGLFDRVKEAKESAGRILHCRAMIFYIDHWLSPDPDTKRELLDECWRLEKEALKIFDEAGDRLGLAKTCVELARCLADRLDLELDTQVREKILYEAVRLGEKAIQIFSKSGDEHELARAHYITGIHCFNAAMSLQSETKRSRCEQKAFDYANDAVRVSKSTGDKLLLGRSTFLLGMTEQDLGAGSEAASELFKKALQHGIETKDHRIVSEAFDSLAYSTYWSMLFEEDLEKMREKSTESEEYASKAIACSTLADHGLRIPHSYCFGYTANFRELAKREIKLETRNKLLKKAVALGKQGLEHAQRTGSTHEIFHVSTELVHALYYISTMKTGVEKRQLLEESMTLAEKAVYYTEQLRPQFMWPRVLAYEALALIMFELSKLEESGEKRKELLEKSVSRMETCTTLFRRHVASARAPSRRVFPALLGRFQTELGNFLNQLYQTTSEKEVLGRLIETYQRSIEMNKKANLVSRVAEAYWQTAVAYDRLGEYLESASNFESASKQYKLSAHNIPQLDSFYMDYVTYMQAWSEIEKARHYHARQEYSQAKKHYEKAASLHRSSESWKYLASNYLAWAQLEHGEDLSRDEQSQKAIPAFQKAAELFREAKRTLRVESDRIENADEKDLAKRLVKASGTIEEYCFGRIALEEAKILDRQGDHGASSFRYGSAAERFQKAIDNMEREADRQELKPIIYLCRAWQMMTKAEAEASPNLYLEASQLFDEAKEHSLNEKAKLLALGHSRFCKALEAGTRFEDSRDTMLYLAATQHLESAANYYVKAGFKIASEYAIATQRLFDAYVYMDSAKKEADPEKKARYYMVAERVLQTSAGSYLKAKHPAKSEQVHRLLEKVREERELAVSLSEVLHAPTITSSTASFVTPTPTEETAVGLERFEHANVQANLILHVKEIRVGEDFNLEIQIANVGKETVLLAKVDEILPAGFELVAKPSYCYAEDMHLNMRGKRLDPLKTEKIRLILRSFDKGTFEIRPKIIYVDETGHQMISELETVTIEVSKVVLPDRITTRYESLDNLLLGGIPKNYAVILTSPSCDERDLLIKNFVEAGAKEGQVTFHVVTNVTSGMKSLAEEFQLNFFLFVCNPQADKIIKSLPNVFKLKGVENLTDINIALFSAFHRLNKSQKGSRRICVEIVSDVLLQHHAVQTRRWLNSLIPELKSKDFTTLAVMDPQMHPSEEVRAILDLFEGEINIYEKETRKGPEKFLKIKKMTNQKYSKKELSLQEEKL